MTVVLCHGTFDVLHLGHVRLFREARRFGSKLIVTLTADAFVNKGPGRPIFSEYERLEMIRSCKYVDDVDIVRAKTGVPAIQKFKPAFYVKGADYLTEDKHGFLEEEREAIEAIGGSVLIMQGPLSPSSMLIQKIAKWKEANEARPRAIVARR